MAYYAPPFRAGLAKAINTMNALYVGDTKEKCAPFSVRYVT